MTTHYVDIIVVPDPETTPEQLLGALYERVHRSLPAAGSVLGVSFPGHALSPRTLGRTLRLHGAADTLDKLMQTPWLGGVRDHVRIGAVAVAPADAPHRLVQRQQFKTSAARIRRRRMRRKGETEQQAATAVPTSMERTPNLPFVRLRSHSTRQTFCLFIAVGPPLSAPVIGQFNAYGLGPNASVPWF